MKITNKFNLPQIVSDTIMFYINKRFRSEENIRADYSVTQLLNAPTITTLYKKYGELIERDISDMIHVLQGNMIHTMFEIASLMSYMSNRAIVEQQFFVDYKGKIISGIPDCIDTQNRILIDYKYLSVYGGKSEKNREQYIMQVNLYRYLIQNGNMLSGGKEISSAPESYQIILFYKDWKKASASGNNENYPQSPIEIIEGKFYSSDIIEKFLDEKIEILDNYKNMLVAPPCSPEERWEDPVKFAVIKKGNKRATKICDSKEEATVFIDENRLGDAIIETRESDPKRCLMYCDVNKFCSFYLGYIREKNGEI